MGRIVGATLCTHIPPLLMPASKRREYLKGRDTSFFDAFPKMYRERIKPLEKKYGELTFLIVDTHWWTTREVILLGRKRLRGVYTSSELPYVISCHRYNYKGDPQLADLIVEQSELLGENTKVIVARQPHLHPEYPTFVTMRYLNPRRRHLVLTSSVAYTSSVKNELALGRVIRHAVAKSNRNVVFVATGGLSHKFPTMDEMDRHASADPKDITIPENREADDVVVTCLRCGNHQNLINRMDGLRELVSPEGRFEHYIRMVGALGIEECSNGPCGRQYGLYESALGTGQIMMWFDPFDS